MEIKMNYLGMIQNVINRMASNSFLLKGWTVTLVVGLLAFANVKDMDSKYIIIALIPALIFWILDGFFIYQEWLYIKLYEKATKLDEKDIDFSLNARGFAKETRGWIGAILSKTLLLFYVPINGVILIALFFYK